MNELPFIENDKSFQEELLRLRTIRKDSKVKKAREYSLSKADREIIWKKTDGHCHICGISVRINKYEADHVKAHSKDGKNNLDNFLPACKICNNYRWHYLEFEMQWILKLGVWSRTEIEKQSKIGQLIAKEFISHEKRREKRRSKPRLS